jgi:hypothetical protein
LWERVSKAEDLLLAGGWPPVLSAQLRLEIRVKSSRKRLDAVNHISGKTLISLV